MTEIGIPQQDFFVLFVQDRFAYVVVQTDFETDMFLPTGQNVMFWRATRCGLPKISKKCQK